MSIQLLEPLLTGGIRQPNFFNGRLLTAETLRAGQTANRQQHQQLGQAIGAGIVSGLDVTLHSGGAQPVVRVSAGLALNRLGQALALAADADVALTAALPSAAPAGLFAPCAPPGTQPVGVSAGVYVLALCPASGYSAERAPLHGFADDGRINGCGTRDTIEGVQFRLVLLDVQDTAVVTPALGAAILPLLNNPDTAAQSRLRSLLAHACLGALAAADFPTALYAYLSGSPSLPETGALARLRAAGALSDCDVPLALLHWTGSGVQFVDRWAAARRVTPPHPAAAGALVGAWRRAVGEAAFLQFQAHVAHLTRTAVPQSQLTPVQAAEYFAYLPAAGVIPLAGSGASRGFNAANFFSGLVTRPAVTIPGDRVLPLLQQSFLYDPVDLNDVEFLWLYEVRDNRQAIDDGVTPAPAPYLLFTSGHLPYAGTPLFDQARWDYSHYSE